MDSRFIELTRWALDYTQYINQHNIVMNKLKFLSNYLKSAGLTEQYRLIAKLAQIENKDPFPQEEEDDIYSNYQKLDDWMSGLPSDSMTTASSKSIDTIEDSSGKNSVDIKPSGIWYAPGSVWLTWMSREAPSWLNDINYIYKITPNYSGGLDSSGGVLRLSTEDDVNDFSERFGVNLPGFRSVQFADWSAVASIWDGIEIIPYQDSLKYERLTAWYSSWHLSSGCIWRPSGVSSLELISSRPGK